MPKVPFAVHYFRPHFSESAPHLHDLFLEVSATKSDDPRRLHQPTDQFAMRLHHLVQRDTVWMGDAYYYDLATAAHHGGLDGTEDIFKLEEGRGVVTPTAFLYSPQHDVLILQSRNDAINRTRFAYFIEQVFTNMNHRSGKIEMAPVFGIDAMKRFAELGGVSKVFVNVASGIDTVALQEAGDGVEQMIKTAHDVGGLRMKIEISTGQKGKTLDFDQAVDFVQSFSKTREDLDLDLASLKVSGYHPGEPGLDHVELVNERMRDSIRLDPNDDGLVLYHERSAALSAFYDQREPELDAMYLQ